MFGSLGWERLFVLAVLALIILGPERLPSLARELGRALRAVRSLAQDAREQLNAELGPEFADLDLQSLSPAAFVRHHLMDDDGLPGTGEAVAPQSSSSVRLLAPGEAAPYDLDAT